MPQRIDRCEDTTIFFRVTDVHAAVRILVKNGEGTVMMRKRPRVAPGEMETVRLLGTKLQNYVGQTLTIELEEETEHGT